MGARSAGDDDGPAGLLHRIPQARRTVRELGGRLPAASDQPERARQTRRAGHGAALGAGRTLALCAHHGAARRRGECAAAGDEEGGQRGCGAPRARQDRGGGGGRLAARAAGILHAAAVGRAVDTRDVDTTVKPLYGHQEAAEVGYNPSKRGRPSHVYHSYLMAELRLVLEVEVASGKAHSAKHAAPGLWALLDRLGPACAPSLLRGDSDGGSEAVMREAEGRGQPYLFKLRLRQGVKRVLERAMRESDWQDAGAGWQGKWGWVRLLGWGRQRRVVLLRRRLPHGAAPAADNAPRQLSFVEVDARREAWEYAVLVTSLEAELLTIAQLYRSRGDAENNFDELKNQWGWGGFTTHDVKRCQFMA